MYEFHQLDSAYQSQQIISDILGDARYNLILFNNVPLEINPRHIHPYYELFYITEGSATFMSDNNSFTIHKDDLVIIPPHTYHNFFSTNSANCYKMVLTFEKSERSTKELIYEDFLKIFSMKYPIVFNDSKYFKTILEKVSNTHIENNQIRIRSLCSTFLFLLTDIANEKEFIRVESGTYKDSLYKYPIDNYFGQHYAEQISIKDLSEKLFLNPHTVGRIVKQLYGKTFNEIKNEYRIENAKYLLLNTNNTISIIAEQIGYTSTKNFYSTFIKYVGCTPGNYRSEHSNHKN